jgi:hypothetical protein
MGERRQQPFADGEPLFGRDFLSALVDKGIVPPETTRVVIEATANDFVQVHYRVVGDERLLTVVDELALAEVRTETAGG